VLASSRVRQVLVFRPDEYERFQKAPNDPLKSKVPKDSRSKSHQRDGALSHRTFDAAICHASSFACSLSTGRACYRGYFNDVVKLKPGATGTAELIQGDLKCPRNSLPISALESLIAFGGVARALLAGQHCRANTRSSHEIALVIPLGS
jgi:hypothetical protein